MLLAYYQTQEKVLESTNPRHPTLLRNYITYINKQMNILYTSTFEDLSATILVSGRKESQITSFKILSSNITT